MTPINFQNIHRTDTSDHHPLNGSPPPSGSFWLGRKIINTISRLSASLLQLIEKISSLFRSNSTANNSQINPQPHLYTSPTDQNLTKSVTSIATTTLSLKSSTPNKLIAAIAKNDQEYFSLSDDLQRNPTIILAFLKADGKNLQHIPKELRGNVTYIQEAIEQNGSAIEHADFSQFNAEEKKKIVLKVINDNTYSLQSCLKIDPTYCDDDDIMNLAIQKNVHNMQYASNRLKNDATFIITAIKKDPHIFQYASTEIQSNIQIAFLALALGSSAKYIPQSSPLTMWIPFINAIKKNQIVDLKQFPPIEELLNLILPTSGDTEVNHLRIALSKSINDQLTIFKEALEEKKLDEKKQKQLVLQLFDATLEILAHSIKITPVESTQITISSQTPQQYQQEALKIVQNNGLDLFYIKPELCTDYKMIALAAVEKFPQALKHAHNLSLEEYKHLALIAVRNDSGALQYVDPKMNIHDNSRSASLINEDYQYVVQEANKNSIALSQKEPLQGILRNSFMIQSILNYPNPGQRIRLIHQLAKCPKLDSPSYIALKVDLKPTKQAMLDRFYSTIVHALDTQDADKTKKLLIALKDLISGDVLKDTKNQTVILSILREINQLPQTMQNEAVNNFINAISSKKNKNTLIKQFRTLLSLKESMGELFFKDNIDKELGTLQQNFASQLVKMFHLTPFIEKNGPIDPNIEERFRETFGLNRQIMALFTYKLKIDQLTEEKVTDALNCFVYHVLKGDFEDFRHKQLKDQPHLQTLSQTAPDLLAKWFEKPEKIELNNNYNIAFSTDPNDLLLIGTEVQGSCQSVDSDPSWSKCLLGYIIDGGVQPIIIKDKQGKIHARAILRLLKKGDEQPVLFLEKIYSNSDNQEWNKAIIEMAKNKATDMQLPLLFNDSSFQKHAANTQTTLLQYDGGRAPYMYLDSGDGVVRGNQPYTIPNAYIFA